MAQSGKKNNNKKGLFAPLQNTKGSRFHLQNIFDSEILIINRRYWRWWKFSRENDIIAFFVSSTGQQVLILFE